MASLWVNQVAAQKRSCARLRHSSVVICFDLQGLHQATLIDRPSSDTSLRRPWPFLHPASDPQASAELRIYWGQSQPSSHECLAQEIRSPSGCLFLRDHGCAYRPYGTWNFATVPSTLQGIRKTGLCRRGRVRRWRACYPLCWSNLWWRQRLVLLGRVDLLGQNFCSF